MRASKGSIVAPGQYQCLTLLQVYGIPLTGILYDVTNTYLYGKRCGLAKLGHDKEGVKGRPLIQVGLAVTKDSGIPVCHKVLDGNIHDARLFKDFLTDLRPFKIYQGGSSMIGASLLPKT